MNAKTLAKINRFGKIGKLVMTLLLIAAILAALLCSVAAAYIVSLPKNALQVTVTDHARFQINAQNFSDLWYYLVDGVSYAAEGDPAAMLRENADSQLLPPEDTELNTELNFLNRAYTSATVHSQGSDKIIDAKSASAEYRASDLAALAVFAALVAASSAAALWALRKLFGVLSTCESPFCQDFVSRLRVFGYWLLPVAVSATLEESLARRFLSAGRTTGVAVQWGVLIAFGVTMCLVTVFRYGVQLQKESDETL